MNRSRESLFSGAQLHKQDPLMQQVLSEEDRNYNTLTAGG